MLGVVSSMLIGRESAAGGPAGATASADFINGIYAVGGTLVTAADVVSEPGWITANGMEIPEWIVGGAVHLLGGLLSAVVTADWTVVLEYQELVAGSFDQTMLLHVNNGVDASDGLIDLQRFGTTAFQAGHKAPAGSYVSIADEDPAPIGTGVHKLAYTRTDAKISLSADGTAVVTHSQSVTGLALTTAVLGGEADADDWSWEATYIRSIIVYAAQDDSALPGLSAL